MMDIRVQSIAVKDYDIRNYLHAAEQHETMTCYERNRKGDNMETMYARKNVIFWNVDTQYDFMRDDGEFKGRLPIPGARSIEKNLETLTRYAKRNDIKVVNTADWHTIDDAEISSRPDYDRTYPPHCMQDTKGAQFVPATAPENAYAVGLNESYLDVFKVRESRNLVLYKDVFNAFLGNRYTERIVDLISREKDPFIVYGVATNVCVDMAVRGLLDMKRDVYVVSDAIKELPDGMAKIPAREIFRSWGDKVKIIQTKDIGTIVQKYSKMQSA